MSFTKQVVGGAGMITLASAGARLLSFITVPILSPLLGPVPYGIMALAGTVVSLCAILALFGIDTAYARFYLQENSCQRDATERFCWRFAILTSLCFSAAAGLGWYWLGPRWLPDYYQLIAIYSIFAIGLSVSVAMATTRIRLTGNYRKIAYALSGAALASVAVNLGVALLWRADVWALLLGTLAGLLTTLALLGLPAPSILMTQSGLPVETKKAVLVLGAATSITAPLFWVIASSDRWFLAEFSSNDVIGVYSMAANIALLGMMLNSSLTLTWLPEASRLYGQDPVATLQPLGRLWERLMVGLALAWLVIVAAGGDVLRLLAAPQFYPGAVYIPWLAGGIFFYGLAGLTNTVFILTNRMQIVVWIWVAGTVVCLGLNAWLIPREAAYGAALAQCISYGVIGLGILAASRRIMPIVVDWRRLGLSVALAMLAGILMSPAWLVNPALSLLIKLPIGLAVTALLVYLIAQDWYLQALVLIRKRLRSEGI